MPTPQATAITNTKHLRQAGSLRRLISNIATAKPSASISPLTTGWLKTPTARPYQVSSSFNDPSTMKRGQTQAVGPVNCRMLTAAE